MQQAGELIIRQIAMSAKQGSVLFPQDIYFLYHAVTGTEKMRNIFIVLGLYVIVHILHWIWW